MSNLTNEEQLAVLNSHRKNLDYNSYNLEVSTIEENAKSTPNADVLTSLRNQMSEITKQKVALDAEIAKVTPVTPA
jgi:hypothetical protein